ncbi:MAG TPA: hypothetical protein VGR81_05440 [Candidatus Acidoferrales bacterium]|nr:hypothetical protein [Candidatus Acidoferrales bacterium]
MAEKSESARTTIILAVVCVAIGTVALSYGLQTLTSFEVRRWASANPYLNLTPQPMPSTAVSPAQEKNLSAYGVSFAAAWKGIATQRQNAGNTEFDFKQGPFLIFFDPDAQKNIIETIEDGDPQLLDRYKAVFGDPLFSSDYELYSAVYAASPAEVTPFMSRANVIRTSTLLQWKLGFGAYGASTIFTMQTQALRGLQFGDPSRDRVVVEQLFDNHKRQYKLLFTSKAGPGTILQADINCVVNSLHAGTTH